MTNQFANDKFRTNNKNDPYNLERFKQAQDTVYHRVALEIERGCKQSHWMWFIFPQIDGLAKSLTARKFALKNKNEALAYLKDPLLAGRLGECCRLLLQVKNKSASEIMGYPDDLKLRSSMTLFASISESNSLYHQVLEQFYNGEPDPLTLRLLSE